LPEVLPQEPCVEKLACEPQLMALQSFNGVGVPLHKFGASGIDVKS